MFGQTIFVAALAGASLVAGQVQPYGPGQQSRVGNATVVTTTKVVSRYTTYCPGPTVLAFNGKKYTATKAGYLTISDCPCTVVEPCHTCAGPRPTPPVYPGKVAYPVPGNGPVAPVAPVHPGKAAVAPVAPGVQPGKAADAPVAPVAPGVQPGKAAVAPVAPGVQPGKGPVAPVQTSAPEKAPEMPNQKADKAAPAVEVAGADGRHVAYSLAMVAAGVVGYLAL